MALSYTRQIEPLEGVGVTDADIAATLSADQSRYTSQSFTVGEIASALAAAGKDGVGIVNRVLDAMVAVGPTNRLVQNKLDQLQTATGAVDLGNLLQRTMLQQFADAGLLIQTDVDALLALATVPDAITQAEVTRCRVEHQASLYVGRVQEAIASERDSPTHTAATVKSAVDAVEA